MVKGLGSKPTEWESTVAADVTSLFEPSSSKSVRKVLSTAGSRAPQKQLCTAVVPYISQMIENEHGCSILISLVKYGTKQTVSAVVTPSLKALNPKSLSAFQAELVREATRRPHCSEESDSSLEGVTKVLLTNLSYPFSLRAVAGIVAQDASCLAKFKFPIALNSAPNSESLSFLQEALTNTENAGAVSTALWKILGKKITPEQAGILASAGRPTVDEIAVSVINQGKVTDLSWSSVVALCIRDADEKISQKLTEAVLSHEPEAKVVAAVQARFPDKAFASPKLSAVATQWARAHQSAFLRTRETVLARVSQKRSREADEEF